MAVTVLSSAAEVLLAADHDPFARGTLGRPLTRAWLGPGAVAWLGEDAEERQPYLSMLGAPGAVAALLAELLPELPPRQRVTLPQGTAALLPAWVALRGADWDFRWLAGLPPRQPGEEQVAVVTDLAAVATLLDATSPRTRVRPGDDAARSWLGVTGGVDGELLACAADTSSATGVGRLSAIAVDPAARGRGLGRAVTAAFARRQFDSGCDVVTLGTYADNAPARAVYDALGFHDGHPFTSGALVVRSHW